MAAFGSVDSPFNEAFGRIIEVHWKKKDTLPCDGTSALTGRWGTLDDNSFVQETTSNVSTGTQPLGYWRMEFNGFFAGAYNSSAACNVDYTVSTIATIAGTTDTETNTDTGTLLPGQSFIVGIVRSGWLDTYLPPSPFAPPSFDQRFIYGFGEYRLLEVSLSTTTYDPP